MPWLAGKEGVRLLPGLVRAGAALLRRRDATVATLVREHTEAAPERVLLRFEGETLTRGAFNDGVNAFVAVFRQAGVGREPVALLMENSPTLLMAQVAAAKTGAIAALVDARLSGAALTAALRATTARHVFTDATCLARAAAPPESASLTLWGQGDPAALPPHVEPLDAALAAAPRREPDPAPVRPDDPFLYLFTGGSAGNPRPVRVRHRRFVAAGAVLAPLLGITADDVVYAPLPLSHAAGNLLGFAVALNAGAAFASRRRSTPGNCLDDLHRHGASVLVHAGELCRYLLREPARADDRSHRLRLAVGAGLRRDVWNAFRERFAVPRLVEVYGHTGGSVALLNLSGRVGSVGRPLPGLGRDVRLARCDPASGDLVRDADGFLAASAPGEAGELLCRVRETRLLRHEGFLDPQAAAARVVRDAFRRGDRWVRTGDLLRRADDGHFELVDHAADTLRSGGAVVSMLELADALNGRGGIAEACAFTVDLPGRGAPAVMVAVVPERDTPFDGVAFHRAVQALAPAARPVFVRLVARMDVNGVWRQRRDELRRQGYDPARLSDPLFVRSDAEDAYVPLTPERLARLRGGSWVVSPPGAG